MEEYQKVGNLYHKRKNKRNLFLVNTVFIILLVLLILLPIKLYLHLVFIIILLVFYGVTRLWSLNK